MSRNQGTFLFASNFEPMVKAPLDARQVVGSLSNLTGSTTWNVAGGSDWLYDGLVVSVASDPTPSKNGLYFLKAATGYTNICNWVKQITTVPAASFASLTGYPVDNANLQGVLNLYATLHCPTFNGTVCFDTDAIQTRSISAAQFNYLSGVTSPIQTQINSISVGGSLSVTGATNGLKKAGRNIALGGILTGNTAINIDSGNLYITGTSVNGRTYGLEVNNNYIGLGDYFDGTTGKAYLEVYNSSAIKAVEMYTSTENNQQYSNLSVHDDVIQFASSDYRYGQSNTSSFQAYGSQLYFGVDDSCGNGKTLQLSTEYALKYMGDYSAAMNGNGSTLVTADWVSSKVLTGATPTWTSITSKPAYLGYVSGLTSAAQTQLNAKLATTTFNTYTGTTAPATFAQKSLAITGATNLGSGGQAIFTSVSANKIQLKGLKVAGTGLSLASDSTSITVSGATIDIFSTVSDTFLLARAGTALTGVSQSNFITQTKLNTYTGTTAPATYYNKTQINSYSGATNTLISNRLLTSAFNTYSGATNTLISNRLLTSAFNTYSGATNTAINNKLASSIYSTYTGTTAPAQFAPFTPTIVSKSTTYTVDATDANKIIEANGTFTITLPNGMATGMMVDIVNVGTGTITLAASTTLQSAGTKLITQYTGVSAYHRGSNIWLAVGRLTV